VAFSVFAASRKTRHIRKFSRRRSHRIASNSQRDPREIPERSQRDPREIPERSQRDPREIPGGETPYIRLRLKCCANCPNFGMQRAVAISFLMCRVFRVCSVTENAAHKEIQSPPISSIPIGSHQSSHQSSHQIPERSQRDPREIPERSQRIPERSQRDPRDPTEIIGVVPSSNAAYKETREVSEPSRRHAQRGRIGSTSESHRSLIGSTSESHRVHIGVASESHRDCRGLQIYQTGGIGGILPKLGRSMYI
jgi:translation initiation factor 2 beta subunit (eIF-2beta)/eIF-5